MSGKRWFNAGLTLEDALTSQQAEAWQALASCPLDCDRDTLAARLACFLGDQWHTPEWFGDEPARLALYERTSHQFGSVWIFAHKAIIWNISVRARLCEAPLQIRLQVDEETRRLVVPSLTRAVCLLDLLMLMRGDIEDQLL